MDRPVFLKRLTTTKEYDQVIDMLDMSVDSEIELTHSEFRQYVRDEWGWSEMFNTTAVNYVGDGGEYPKGRG